MILGIGSTYAVQVMRTPERHQTGVEKPGVKFEAKSSAGAGTVGLCSGTDQSSEQAWRKV